MLQREELRIEDCSYRGHTKSYHHIFSIILIFLTMLTVISSIVILLDLTQITLRRRVLFTLIFLNLFFAVILFVVIILKLTPIISNWRAKRHASRLHIQIISLFSIVATIPALFVAIIAVVTFNYGLDRWFNKSTTDIVNSSIDIANVYADETLRMLHETAYIIANSIDNSRLLDRNQRKYKHQLTLQAAAYNLKGAFLLDSNAELVIGSDLGEEASIPIPPN